MRWIRTAEDKADLVVGKESVYRAFRRKTDWIFQVVS